MHTSSRTGCSAHLICKQLHGIRIKPDFVITVIRFRVQAEALKHLQETCNVLEVTSNPTNGSPAQQSMMFRQGAGSNCIRSAADRGTILGIDWGCWVFRPPAAWHYLDTLLLATVGWSYWQHAPEWRSPSREAMTSSSLQAVNGWSFDWRSVGEDVWCLASTCATAVDQGPSSLSKIACHYGSRNCGVNVQGADLAGCALPKAETDKLMLLREFTLDNAHFFCESLDITRPYPSLHQTQVRCCCVC